MSVDGKLRFDSREVSGCILRTGVVRRNHPAHFRTFFQKLRTGHTYLMEYDIRPWAYLMKFSFGAISPEMTTARPL